MSDDVQMDPLFFEKILIKFLFSDIEVREKILPFLIPDIFDGFSTKEIVQTIISFIEKNDSFPTIPEMKLELHSKDAFDCLFESLDIDISDYNKEYILEKMEDFFKRKMILNELAQAASALKEDDLDGLTETPDKIREKMAFSFNTEVGLDLFSDVGRDRIYKHLHSKDKVVSSGLKTIDKLITGGFHEKSLSLFLAETNLGKSLIMCSLAVNALLDNKKVLYISLEMSEEKITERILSNLFDIDIGKLRFLTKKSFDSKFKTIGSKFSNKFSVKEFPPRSLNTNKIRNLLKELKVKRGFVPDIIFVDYMGLMVPINTKNGDNSYGEQKRVSEELRAIGVEFGLPVVSAVQTNRGGFSSATIDLTDVSDSIGTAATADLIVGVTQTDEYREAGRYCFIILKNRYGINKMKQNVCVEYPKMRIFDDLEETENGIKPMSPSGSNAKSTRVVDDAAVDILKKMKTEKKHKRSEITGIEMD